MIWVFVGGLTVMMWLIYLGWNTTAKVKSRPWWEAPPRPLENWERMEAFEERVKRL